MADRKRAEKGLGVVKYFILFSTLCFVGFGCGKPSGKSGGGDKNRSGDTSGGGGNGGSGDENFKVIEGDIAFEGGVFSGSGSLIFKDTLGSTKEQKGFEIDFSLLEEGATVELHVFAEEGLKNSMNFRFIRLPGNKIEYWIKDGKRTADIGVSAEEKISLYVEVHNSEGANAHLIVELNNNGEELTNGTGGQSNWGNGGGTFWGLTLDQVKVSRIVQVPAKYGH